MTLAEVAKKSGVSKSAVADILRGQMKYSYKPDTIERVRLVADEVGYRPHTTASLMRAKRTHLIGIFAVNPRGAYSSLLVNALVQELKQFPPYRPMFIDPTAMRESKEASFGFELLEGLFWTLPVSDYHFLKPLLRNGKPHLVALANIALPLSCVTLTVGEGSYQAAEHLIQLGHRRIAVIHRAPPGNTERLDGYKLAFEAHGLKLDPLHCLPMPDEYDPSCYYRAGFELTQQLMKSSPEPPTAILCHNDEVAIGALQAAHKLGLQVPRDLSVVGFDGVPQGEYSVPPLTTVRLPIEQMAAAAVQLMIQHLENPNQGAVERKQLRCSLRIGGSTASPPSRGCE